MSVKNVLHEQFGDTIVEVMIVLAVLGFAIGIAYATANRSLLNARQAQENSQASALVQSQAETLRTMAGNPPTSSDYIYQSGSFCIGTNGHRTTTAANCDQGESSRYHINITRAAASDTFSIKATWNDVFGQGTDSVTLQYRVHPSP